MAVSLSFQVTCYPEVASTMDLARIAAEDGAAEGTVIQGLVQKRGAGGLVITGHHPPEICI